MGNLKLTDMERLGLYRISPGLLGWLSELFTTPVALFLILFTLSSVFNGSRPHAVLIAVLPTVLCFLPNVTFLLYILLERKNSRTDILYLRNYAKPSFVKSVFTRDIGTLQLLVRGILRPPYDIVSLFPPPKTDDERRRDARRKLKRGIHHVFTLRTRNEPEWREAVDHLLLKSKLVIVECYRVKDKGGFDWELHRIPQMIDARKVLLISEQEDRQYAEEIQRLLLNYYSKKEGPVDQIPLIVFNRRDRRGQMAFKNDLIATVRERAPYSDEFVQERSKLIIVEVGLKLLTQMLTLLWWISVGAAVIALVVLAV